MTLWIGYWWCDHCAVAVDSEHATIAATHSLASGGCGKRLTERFNSTEPPEDDELTRVTAERDALAAENARLREAVAWRPIETAPCDDTVVLVYWRDGQVSVEDSDHDSDPDWWAAKGARYWCPLPEPPDAARALVEAPR